MWKWHIEPQRNTKRPESILKGVEARVVVEPEQSIHVFTLKIE